jgi:alkylated DNA repair dioxygenase AlkB
MKTKPEKLITPAFFNLYHSGDEGMGWHSDGEKELKKMEPLISKFSEKKICF